MSLVLSVCQLSDFCWALCLSVCQLGDFCLAWGLSLCPSQQVMFGMGFVCLSILTSYVWHGVCLFIRLNKLCLAWGLSVRLNKVMFGMGFVCSKHSSLIVFGIFVSPEKDCLLVLKRTGYCSRTYILPSCQVTAPSLLK